MALKIKHKDSTFGVGDTVKVSYLVKEGDKERTQIFNGMVIAIKGREKGKTFTVRRIGAQKIGIERIFPLESPNVTKVEVEREGLRGVRSSKLYYLRGKSKRETEKIYKRAKAKRAISANEKRTKKDDKTKTDKLKAKKSTSKIKKETSKSNKNARKKS